MEFFQTTWRDGAAFNHGCLSRGKLFFLAFFNIKNICMRTDSVTSHHKYAFVSILSFLFIEFLIINFETSGDF